VRISLNFWSGHLKRCSSSSLSRWHAGHWLLVQNPPPPHWCILFPTGANLWLILSTILSVHARYPSTSRWLPWCWWASCWRVRLSLGSLPCFVGAAIYFIRGLK
jgi:hypothetical protein